MDGMDSLTQLMGKVRNYFLRTCVNFGHNFNVYIIKDSVLRLS